MRVWIDADACPKAAKDQVIKFALKRQFEVVLVALLLGESLQPGQWPTYALVFAAIAVLLAEGISQLLRQRKRRR